ncbi:hypothetical protein I5677_15290 [Mobilitalea sibirica]|uniref:Glycosyl hydrolase family 95 catalytic domain-containing protein n=1 Tax=Mobilitalea sibirica TaxID=1462919 RepID=A0A8J7H0Z6_9FIRM|nr:hypothetical protein [Mobilitalea sibirica]MBH1942264.1 hypothetical protein [Mobilitalea sibirica]
MKEAAIFFLNFLTEDKGCLKTCPSESPENTYIQPKGHSTYTMILFLIRKQDREFPIMTADLRWMYFDFEHYTFYWS